MGFDDDELNGDVTTLFLYFCTVHKVSKKRSKSELRGGARRDAGTPTQLGKVECERQHERNADLYGMAWARAEAEAKAKARHCNEMKLPVPGFKIFQFQEGN
jgi:hypothetical protein